MRIKNGEKIRFLSQTGMSVVRENVTLTFQSANLIIILTMRLFKPCMLKVRKNDIKFFDRRQKYYTIERRR